LRPRCGSIYLSIYLRRFPVSGMEGATNGIYYVSQVGSRHRLLNTPAGIHVLKRRQYKCQQHKLEIDQIYGIVNVSDGLIWCGSTAIGQWTQTIYVVATVEKERASTYEFSTDFEFPQLRRLTSLVLSAKGRILADARPTLSSETRRTSGRRVLHHNITTVKGTDA
jgi:hypothetical protein